ncbi:MAG TPA: PilZ domain-containing protein [Nitrospiraceae bacterium]|nr:PilZ domain-containing protein [Nitrospiraceae bacterium]
MEIVCSQCRKPFVQAVRRQGVLDRLLHWAYIHPYGCQICRHRFYVMQWGLRPPEAPVDGSQYRMRPVRVHAMLTDEQGEHEGMMTDLSASGCIIETRTSLLEGTLLGIRLDAVDDEPPIVVETAIVRSALGARVEMEFLRLAQQENARLNQFITNLWIEGTQIARSSGGWKTQPHGTP